MLNTRSYRNNLGYQIDIDRFHPIRINKLDRINKNNYYYDGYNVNMTINKTSEYGLQYGGGKKIEQSGDGLDFQTISNTLKLLHSGTKKLSDFYSSETGNMIKNKYGKFMNSNKNWRPGFVGEKHMINKQGLTYNFLGPGTNIQARIDRNDPPLDGYNGLDSAARVHDIAYSKANNWSEVRKADKEFIKNVEKSTANNLSKTFIKGLFKVKNISEDSGIVKPSYFTKFPNIQDSIPKKIQEPQTDFEGKGIEFNSNSDPTMKLKNKLKNKIKKQKNNKKIDKLMGIAMNSIKKRL